mgnify:CR=1 FL=1
MLEFQTEEGILRVMLQGEIDHHSAGQLREQIDCRLEELLPKRLILDFTGVTFMDSVRWRSLPLRIPPFGYPQFLQWSDPTGRQMRLLLCVRMPHSPTGMERCISFH